MSEIPPTEFPGEEIPVGGAGLERMLDLSNGVFGFSLTLLAVGIGIPALPSALAATELGPAIMALWPKVIVFGVSFFAVSIYWLAHQRIFRYIECYDSRLLWLNMLFLACVAFMPIPSAILGLYPLQRPAIVFFAGFLTLTGLVNISMWRYATAGRRLVAPELSSRIVRYMYVRAATATSIYLLAIIMAYVAPDLVIGLWLILALLLVFFPPLFRRILAWLERKTRKDR